jgi:hypothetical protein
VTPVLVFLPCSADGGEGMPPMPQCPNAPMPQRQLSALRPLPHDARPTVGGRSQSMAADCPSCRSSPAWDRGSPTGLWSLHRYCTPGPPCSTSCRCSVYSPAGGREASPSRPRSEDAIQPCFLFCSNRHASRNVLQLAGNKRRGALTLASPQYERRIGSARGLHASRARLHPASARYVLLDPSERVGRLPT